VHRARAGQSGGICGFGAFGSSGSGSGGRSGSGVTGASGSGSSVGASLIPRRYPHTTSINPPAVETAGPGDGGPARPGNTGGHSLRVDPPGSRGRRCPSRPEGQTGVGDDLPHPANVLSGIVGPSRSRSPGRRGGSCRRGVRTSRPCRGLAPPRSPTRVTVLQRTWPAPLSPPTLTLTVEAGRPAPRREGRETVGPGPDRRVDPTAART